MPAMFQVNAYLAFISWMHLRQSPSIGTILCESLWGNLPRWERHEGKCALVLDKMKMGKSLTAKVVCLSKDRQDDTIPEGRVGATN